ncbi:MAG: hypothetical protein H7Y42_03450 [Chitinophagaceae bacterium]|nr:hypothetical protein [Chitinophagaceae bacterium]
MKTWLLCESCIHAESSNDYPRYDLIRECSECAKACFAVVSRLVSKADDLGDLVFNCLLHCRQCSEECLKYNGEEDIELCGDVCEVCGNTLKNIAVFSLN